MNRPGLNTRPSGAGRTGGAAMLTPLLLVLCSGCVEQRVVHDGWAWLGESGWKSTAASGSTNASAEGTAPATRSGWSIQVASFTGRRRYDQARQLAAQVRQSAGFGDVWIEDQGNRTRVLVGRYRTPDDYAAAEDLNLLRMTQIDDQMPFAAAELVPLGGQSPDESASPYDLKQFVGMYSLQIGFYDDAVGPEFRKAAERAVQLLREQGEQAYFYHGPHRSLICLGLFTDNDFTEVDGVRVYGDHIKQLQQKHPHNLANGYTQIEKHDGQAVAEQPSFLVRVF